MGDLPTGKRNVNMTTTRKKLQKRSSNFSWQIMTTTMLTDGARGSNWADSNGLIVRVGSLESPTPFQFMAKCCSCCDKLHVILECCASLLLRQVVLTRPRRMQGIKRSAQHWSCLPPVVLLKWNHHHHEVTEAASAWPEQRERLAECLRITWVGSSEHGGSHLIGLMTGEFN